MAKFEIENSAFEIPRLSTLGALGAVDLFAHQQQQQQQQQQNQKLERRRFLNISTKLPEEEVVHIIETEIRQINSLAPIDKK